MRDRAEALARHHAQLEELAEDRLAQLTAAQRRENEVNEALSERQDKLSIFGPTFSFISSLF